MPFAVIAGHGAVWLLGRVKGSVCEIENLRLGAGGSTDEQLRHRNGVVVGDAQDASVEESVM
jgi:hypothetical protein